MSDPSPSAEGAVMPNPTKNQSSGCIITMGSDL